MIYNPEIHHRRSIRLQGYDYSKAGAYFVTICTQNRDCLFGEIVDGKIRLNDAGRMVKRWYSELENKFPDIQCDELVCMPNHIHFIMVNVGADLCVRPDAVCHQTMAESRDESSRNEPSRDESSRGESSRGESSRDESSRGEHVGSPLQRVVQWFKTMSTNEYIRCVKQHGWRSFCGRLWQRNYWEHIVRNELELNRIREYIQNNPMQWESDQLNPINVGADLRVRPDHGKPG